VKIPDILTPVNGLAGWNPEKTRQNNRRVEITNLLDQPLKAGKQHE